MAHFVDNTSFETETCCSCGMKFAMTSDFMRRRRDDHALFYCPAGHNQYYYGKTEAQKLKEQLEQRAAEVARLNVRAVDAESKLGRVARAHKKMRKRIANGVCPCCNRTFQNLLRHMQTEHPDMTKEQTFRELRHAFGMTQADVAREAGVNASQVSWFERGAYHVSSKYAQRLENWFASHTATAADHDHA